MKHNYLKQLKSGILDQNPTLVQLLGMCPTLATTTSLKNAFGMGMAATAGLAAQAGMVEKRRGSGMQGTTGVQGRRVPRGAMVIKGLPE